MIRMRGWIAVAAVVATGLYPAHPRAFAQTSSTTPPTASAAAPAVAPADYSKEPAVVEQAITKILCQDDGTYSEETTVRTRVLSEAALKSFGVLNFAYGSATSSMEVVFVRVIKPDKTVVQTTAENILDVTPDLTREAPLYSDLKEKQVAVKGLEIGDTLEFQFHLQDKSPLAPGQFWFDYSFNKTAIVLDEELQIGVPRDKYVKVKSADVQPTITDRGMVRFYDWKTANLERKPEEQDKPATDADAQPSVRVTTFRTWDDVGQWFRTLASPQAAVTPAIRAKAEELTRNAKTDEEKTRALYAFVSNFRYIGISLGIGRYQPHAASDVLSNEYGDCKDKHTLFAALLSAAGIKAYAALIRSTGKIDSDVPSPGQFDHVITAIPQGNAFLFLDTTPEVAPFGFLVQALRDEQALVIPENGVAELRQTPADPPFKSFFTFQVDGQLDDAGTLVSKMQMTFRGDDELPYRLVFRQTAQPQWKDLVQQISSNMGFGGTVSDVTASSPEATDIPFHVEYSYTRKEFSDWANRRTSPPEPPFFIPQPPDAAEKKPDALKIGVQEETLYQGTLRLPAGANPAAPATIDLHQSFADYHAEYSVANGVMHFQRRLLTKVREIPPEQIEVYRKFYKAVMDDENTFVSLAPDTSESPLPAVSPEVQALLNQAREAYERKDIATAIDFAQRAVDMNPNLSASWVILAQSRLSAGDMDRGVTEIKKAIVLDPSTSLSTYKIVGSTLKNRHLYANALDVWKALEAAKPGDADAPRNIAEILMAQGKYAEAAAELEPAVGQHPAEASLVLRLGEANFHLGDKEKAAEMVMKAAGMDHTAATLNNAAYELADNSMHLDDALGYANDAVQQTETAAGKISLGELTSAGVRTMPALAAQWDTLGWVQFRLGHTDVAEKYLTASWKLFQAPQVADHLGQLEEKLGRKQEAARLYRLAMATGHASPDTVRRVTTLMGTKDYDSQAIMAGLMELRTVTVGRIATGASSSEFFVLFTRGGGAPLVKPVNPSNVAPGAAELLSGAKYDVVFPDDGPEQIVRRGILSCDELTHNCEFVMYPPDGVTSVN